MRQSRKQWFWEGAATVFILIVLVPVFLFLLPKSSSHPSKATGPADVTVDGSPFPVSGYNIARDENKLVIYKPPLTVSPANRWGAEASVVAGKVTKVTDQQEVDAPPLPVPSDGMVLSGHGEARAWILSAVKVGDTVTPPKDLMPVARKLPPLPKMTCRSGYLRLTFDDGPNVTYTPQILHALRGVPATFFVIGKNVAAYPQGVQLEHAAGSKVGNHSYHHPYLTKLSPSAVATELSMTSTIVEKNTGVAPTEWRPPFEDWNATVKNIAEQQGLTMTTWSYQTDSNDWKGLTAQQITDRVLSGAKDGRTILMHDRFPTTVTALPGLMNKLIDRGYCFRNTRMSGEYGSGSGHE